MSDPTPEDLYEALRKRLADYGQEPPPGLWAGIRQQLPPPVAVPRRRRWRASLALLSLLFVVASLATWQWQRAGKSATQSGTAAQSAPAATEMGGERNGRTATAAASAPAGPGASRAVPAASGAANLPAPNDNAAGTQLATGVTNSETNAVASDNSKTKAVTPEAGDFNSTAKSVRPATAGALATTSHAVRRNKALAAAGVASSASAGRQRRSLRSRQGTRLRQEAAAAARLSGEAAQPSALAARPTVAGGGQTPSSAAAPVAAPAAGTSGTLAATRAAASTASRPGAAGPDRAAGMPSAAEDSTPSVSVLGPDAAEAVRWDWLALRTALLQLPAGAALGTPRAVEVPPLPPVAPTVVSRWAVQLVAGPGLTYRHLGTSSSMYAYSTNSVATPAATAPMFSGSIPNRNLATTNTSVASLERPALGYGAQLSLRRTLTPRWTVSAGLGYAEYATSLDLRQVSAAQITRASYDFAFLDSLSRASGTTIRQRDTYRFLTVPLRAGYAWNTGARWQVGLLGGVDATIYLGGTTTEGSACACQPQTWSASNSPYRSLSLAASLGAEVRYRLAGPWQLLAQPTASYLLTPLAKPVSGYAIRHLLGGTALLGVSYDLP